MVDNGSFCSHTVKHAVRSLILRGQNAGSTDELPAPLHIRCCEYPTGVYVHLIL